MDNKESMNSMDSRDSMNSKDSKDNKDSMDNKDSKDSRDYMDTIDTPDIENAITTNTDIDIDTDTAIFEFVYKMAMRDATLRKAYLGEKTGLTEITGAKSAVREYIINVFKGFDSQQIHDKCFYDTVDKVCVSINTYIVREYLNQEEKYLDQEEYQNQREKYQNQREKYQNQREKYQNQREEHRNQSDKQQNQTEERPKFTFGNSQKLINMTAKYMFISAYNNPGLRRKFAFCHCPMDAFMLKHVWYECINKIGKNYWKDKGYTQSGDNGFLKSWSRETKGLNHKELDKSEPKRYCDFQKAVQELIEKMNDDNYVAINLKENTKILSPLEYDYIYWRRNE